MHISFCRGIGIEVALIYIVDEVSSSCINGRIKSAHKGGQQTGQQHTYKTNRNEILDYVGQNLFKIKFLPRREHLIDLWAKVNQP